MINTILERVQKVKKTGDKKYMACCPAHDDSDPSLAINEANDGRILLHCFAGCPAGDVVAAIGLSLSDLFPEGAIDNSLRGATPWIRNQRREKAQTVDNAKLVLELFKLDRAKGKKFTPTQLRAEQEAFQVVRGAS